MSNFDIMNWVKELKIKNFDGVFNKDSRQWASKCGIKNLDSNNGPGTHWACYVDSFYFNPFGLPLPENILFIKRYSGNTDFLVQNGVFVPFSYRFRIVSFYAVSIAV